MPLKRVDLNLFKVFEAVMTKGSVCGAARTLGVTPSAVSHAIARLREALGDELFRYSDSRMVPTHRALEIAPDIRNSLALIADSVFGRAFRPAESRRVFQISTTDYGAVVLISRLVERLAAIAPNIELRLLAYNRADVVRGLDEGGVDPVVGWSEDLPKRIRRTRLLVEREALIVRRGHPLAGKTVADWNEVLAYSFVVVERDSPAPVTLSLPYYSAVPSMLRYSNFVASVPECLARGFARSGEFVLLNACSPPADVNVEALWHERNEGDEALQWLLGQLAGAVAMGRDEYEGLLQLELLTAE